MKLGKSKVEDIDGLATLLNQAGVDFGAEDIADALWLAGHMGDISEIAPTSAQETDRSDNPIDIREEFIEDSDNAESERAQVYLPPRERQGRENDSAKSGIGIKAPAAPALRIRLDLARALRPLRRQVPSPGQLEFDETATLDQIADQQVWFPVLKPVPERWLEVALVVEAMPALPLWQETISEFKTLLERQGAFRRVTSWRLETQAEGKPQLFPHWQRPPQRQNPRQANHLWDAAGRRLILLVSDCTTAAWYDGSLVRWLEKNSHQAPTAVIQLLPEALWPQSALGQGTSMWLNALEPGTVSAKLTARPRLPLLQHLLSLSETQPRQGITLPIVTLEAAPLHQWAKVVAGVGGSQTLGVQFDPATFSPAKVPPPSAAALSAEARVQRFRTTASLQAQRLAELMAAAPVSPPIVDLIRQTLLPSAEPVHVAEVYMGGLMEAQALPEPAEGNPTLAYDFAPGVRPLLADTLSRTKTESVLDAVSRYISARLGLNTRSFEALLQYDFQNDPSAQDLVLPFAEIAIPTLQQMGGEYAEVAEQFGSTPLPSPLAPDDRYPLLQTYTFREATLVFESSPGPEDAGHDLHPFEFDTVTLQMQGQSGQTQLLVQRSSQTAQQFIEDLGQSIDLAMVLIPPGVFMMGSPENEEGRRDNERPQHEVTFADPFFMAKYPITQAQWRVVAAMPQVERALAPDLSQFKGDNRPVEQVSWFDAVEFCARLSQHTGRDYRLPTDAEWEYACRAGTTTPFHFGETITTDVANYYGNQNYGAGPTGEYRAQTTDVGSFPANAFGLYDLHGNVFEWCQDWWHDNYAGAPTDGSAWLAHEEDGKENRVLRGGSWDINPVNCRSAFRFGNAPDVSNDVVGFRVVCGVART